MVLGVLIEVLSRDDLLHNLVENLLSELLSSDSLAVLSADNNGVDTERDDSTAIMGILNGDLGLGVGTEPRKGAVVTGLLHGRVELVSEQKSQGQQLGGLIGSITEHDALVTGTELLKSLIVVQTLSDIGGLLLNGDEDVAGLVVEALVRAVITNVLDGIADDLLVVDVGLGGDLTEDHDHTSLGGGLASDLGEGVLGKAGIEDGIGYLIAEIRNDTVSKTVVGR